MSDEKVLRLHQSMVPTLLDRSPLHALQAVKARKDGTEEPSDDMIRGTLIDRLLLGGGPVTDLIAPINADSYRTKLAREKKEDAIAEGKVPILVGKLAAITTAAVAIQKRLAEKGVELNGKSHVKLEWDSPTTGCPCAGELDHLTMSENSALIIDLKTTRDASPAAVEKSMVRFGAHIQRSAYVEAVETLYPKYAGRVAFLFLYCESVQPHDVLLATPDGTMQALGTAQWRRACLTWMHCLETNDFPGYPNGIVRIAAKPWALNAEMEAGEPAEEE